MARVELIMPKMGESVSEATIISWTKEIGENVELGGTIISTKFDIDRINSHRENIWPSWPSNFGVYDFGRKNSIFLLKNHIYILRNFLILPCETVIRGSQEVYELELI